MTQSVKLPLNTAEHACSAVSVDIEKPTLEQTQRKFTLSHKADKTS
jgi:hypothetical protein